MRNARRFPTSDGYVTPTGSRQDFESGYILLGLEDLSGIRAVKGNGSPGARRMKLRTIAACMLAFAVCPFVRAQNAQLPRNSELEVARIELAWCHADREKARRILGALQSSDEFHSAHFRYEETWGYDELGRSDFEVLISPEYMRRTANWVGLTYDPQWDMSPIGFYRARIRSLDQRIPALEKMVAELSSPPPARKEEGPISVARDEKGRPIVTDDLIRRFLKAEYSQRQTGFAPWRSGNFTQLDYTDVSKRIEWARTVKRSQGGELLVSTPAMREQFSDEEVRVLNSRWRDLENAQNGRWDEVRW